MADRFARRAFAGERDPKDCAFGFTSPREEVRSMPECLDGGAWMLKKGFI